MGTLAERRAAARAALLADPGRTNNAVAAECGCNRMTVSRARHELLSTGAIKEVPVTATDGRVFNFSRKPPVKQAGQTIHRVRELISYVVSRRFSETWCRTTPETQRTLVGELERLQRVLKNLKARMPAPPRPGTSRAGERVYRDPSGRQVG